MYTNELQMAEAQEMARRKLEEQRGKGGSDGLVDLAGEALEAGIEVADGFDAVVEAADGVESVTEAADSVLDGIGDAVGEFFEGADDLPGVAVVGIIVGAVALVGGLVFAVYKLIKRIRNR